MNSHLGEIENEIYLLTNKIYLLTCKLNKCYNKYLFKKNRKKLLNKRKEYNFELLNLYIKLQHTKIDNLLRYTLT